MLTKESSAAIKLLVKYDFTAKNLTQFENFALSSLKKYVESGIEPKLIKTFAETLIKRLSEEEKIELRDKALTKVIKNKERLDDAKKYFKISSILKKKDGELSNDEIYIIKDFLEENNLDITKIPLSYGGSFYRYPLTCYSWHDILKDKGFFREALYFKAKYGISHEVFNDLAKENLKRYIRGVLSEKDFLSLCESEGINIDKAHKVSLRWLDFINLTVGCEVPSSWEESWKEFKESEGFKELI